MRNFKTIALAGIISFLFIMLLACNNDNVQQPVETPDLEPTQTQIPTKTPEPTKVPTQTPLPTSTPVPTDTPMPTPTSTPYPSEQEIEISPARTNTVAVEGSLTISMQPDWTVKECIISDIDNSGVGPVFLSLSKVNPTSSDTNTSKIQDEYILQLYRKIKTSENNNDNDYEIENLWWGKTHKRCKNNNQLTHYILQPSDFVFDYTGIKTEFEYNVGGKEQWERVAIIESNGHNYWHVTNYFDNGTGFRFRYITER